MHDISHTRENLPPDIRAAFEQLESTEWIVQEAFDIVSGDARIAAAGMPPDWGKPEHCTWYVLVREPDVPRNVLDGWTLKITSSDAAASETWVGTFDSRGSLAIGGLPYGTYRATLHAPASNVVPYPASNQAETREAALLRLLESDPWPVVYIPFAGELAAAAEAVVPRVGRGVSLKVEQVQDWEGVALDITVRSSADETQPDLASVRLRAPEEDARLPYLERTVIYIPLDRDGQRTARVHVQEGQEQFDGFTVSVEGLFTIDELIDDDFEAERLVHMLPASRAAVDDADVWRPVLAALQRSSVQELRAAVDALLRDTSPGEDEGDSDG